MIGDMSRLRGLLNVVIESARKGTAYHSRFDHIKALFCRVAATRVGRRWLSGKLVHINLTALRAPICIRTGTADILVLQSIFEQDEYAALNQLNITETASVVDAGANIGLVTVLL